MKDGTPQIDPAYELEIIWSVFSIINEIEDRLVKDGDGPYAEGQQSGSKMKEAD